jgi:hypothetical protein
VTLSQNGLTQMERNGALTQQFPRSKRIQMLVDHFWHLPRHRCLLTDGAIHAEHTVPTHACTHALTIAAYRASACQSYHELQCTFGSASSLPHATLVASAVPSSIWATFAATGSSLAVILSAPLRLNISLQEQTPHIGKYQSKRPPKRTQRQRTARLIALP